MDLTEAEDTKKRWQEYTGMGSYSLLQGIFPTQGSNPGLLHCGHSLYHLRHQGSPTLGTVNAFNSSHSNMNVMLSQHTLDIHFHGNN